MRRINAGGSPPCTFDLRVSIYSSLHYPPPFIAHPSSTNHHPPIRHPCYPSVIHRRWSIHHHQSKSISIHQPSSIGHHPSSMIPHPGFIIGHDSSIIPHTSFRNLLTHRVPIDNPRFIRHPVASSTYLGTNSPISDVCKKGFHNLFPRLKHCIKFRFRRSKLPF